MPLIVFENAAFTETSHSLKRSLLKIYWKQKVSGLLIFLHFKPKAISVNKICLFWKVCGKYHLMTNVFDKRHIRSNRWNAPADGNSAEINLMFGSEMYQRRTISSPMQEICSRKMPLGFKDVTPEGRSLAAGARPRVWCLPGGKGSQFWTGFLHTSLLQVTINGLDGKGIFMFVSQTGSFWSELFSCTTQDKALTSSFCSWECALLISSYKGELIASLHVVNCSPCWIFGLYL